MTILRKKKKETKKKDVIVNQDLINIFINNGGEIAESVAEQEMIRFTMRIPKDFVKEIDASRKRDPSNISRNAWIIRALDKKIQEELAKLKKTL